MQPRITNDDRGLLQCARNASEKSTHPEFKVGAVIGSKRGLWVSKGYNKKPSGSESLSVKNTHAEVIAIASQGRNVAPAHTIYITHPPCSACCAVIVEAEIKRVVYLSGSEEYLKKWGDDCFTGRVILDNAGVEHVEAFEL